VLTPGRPAARALRGRSVLTGLSLVVALVVAGALPAAAAPTAPPTDPTTSSAAKQAWDESAHAAEVAAEALNGAREAQRKAEAAVTAAQQRVTEAKNAQRTAAQNVTSAQATVTDLQGQLDAFANASYRGASVDEMAALLTADNASDFLDQATTNAQVAADNARTLQNARNAKDSASTAQAAAAEASADAAGAEKAAEKAKTDADAAATAAATKKSSLDAASAKYKALYQRLSTAERAKLMSIADAAKAAAGTAVVDQTSGDAAGRAAAAAAITKIGGSYCYACDGPTAFDCSGLTTWAWAQQGISIPRVSYEQANFPEIPLDQLQPGDLVTYYSPVSHVAIYTGYGMVVSAADEALGIIYVPVEKGGPNPTGHRVPRG
jgi:peptidoglycan DL-endopeptidase CwlO